MLCLSQLEYEFSHWSLCICIRIIDLYVLATDASLDSIALNYPSLQAVDFSGCVELTDKGIAAFVMLYTKGFKVCMDRTKT